MTLEQALAERQMFLDILTCMEAHALADAVHETGIDLRIIVPLLVENGADVSAIPSAQEIMNP